MSEPETAEQKEEMEHLALVRALSREISSAISAIERSDLADLTTRIAAQEAICLKLNQNGGQDLRLACASYRTNLASPTQTSLWQRIREQYVVLDRLNRTYAGLIRRSQKSIELITGLYRDPGQRYSKDPSPRPGKHTWSCEA
jgi:hypothetical protein